MEVGPGAGAHGGLLSRVGPPRPLDFRGPDKHPTKRRNEASLQLQGITTHNLDIDQLTFALGCLTVVCGVSGSGKTSLVEHTLAAGLAARLSGSALPTTLAGLEGGESIGTVRVLERTMLGRSFRSCVATAAGAWTPIRELLAQTREARIRGFGPDRFTFNRPGGRCEACRGVGSRRVVLELLPDAWIPCETCEGRRFDRSTLAVRLRGHSVHEILQMEVAEACSAFTGLAPITDPLHALNSVGLGYLPLGQSTNSLSGGEAQRVRLARSLTGASRSSRRGETLLVLDQPTVGLHPTDVHHLVGIFQDLVDRGVHMVCVEN
ncbi:MAG: hypothetical protein QGG40_21850, partial [Myxococcota bacterium]|nr:hypothetical protein [Myxococcota bacterium]